MSIFKLLILVASPQKVVYSFCKMSEPNMLLHNIFLFLIHYEILQEIQHCPTQYNGSPNRSVAILCV